MKWLSCVRLFVTPWTVYYQAPSSMGFSRQEYWSGLTFPSPGDLPDPGIRNSGLPHCRQTPYHLSHQGSPRTIGPAEINGQHDRIACIPRWASCRVFSCSSPQLKLVTFQVTVTYNNLLLQILCSLYLRKHLSHSYLPCSVIQSLISEYCGSLLVLLG